MNKAEESADKIIDLAEKNGMPYHHLQTEALRLTVKDILQQYAELEAIEYVKWLTQHGHNLTDHMGTYKIRFKEWREAHDWLKSKQEGE